MRPVVDQTHRDIGARIALRLLVDTYARHVDRRDTEAVARLFAADGRLVAHFHQGPDGAPSVRTGRQEIAAALVAGLAPYVATTHIVGGQVVEVDVEGEGARGETVCLAHHLYERDGAQRLLVMAVRYEDEFVCESGSWYFAERQLRLDWRDDRPMAERGS
jgi:ketosteroid isomerase-like protein